MTSVNPFFNHFWLACWFCFSIACLTCAIVAPVANDTAHLLVKRDPSFFSGLGQGITTLDSIQAKINQAICNDQQKAAILQYTRESIQLANAAANDLDKFLDDNVYQGMSESERDRIQTHVFAFLGFPSFDQAQDGSQLNLEKVQAFKLELGRARDWLRNIANRDSWPESILMFCDDTFFLDTDLEGKPPPENLHPAPNHVLKYCPVALGGLPTGGWLSQRPDVYCGEADTEYIYTVHLGGGVDAVIWCPDPLVEFMTHEASVTGWDGGAGANASPWSLTDGQTELQDFNEDGGFGALHEAMHTLSFRPDSQAAKGWLIDSWGSLSYHPNDITRMARTDPFNAVQNAESLTYFSVASFYSRHKWNTWVAEPIVG